jgi:hypothetical protein
MSKHNKTVSRKPAIPRLVVTLQPEGWEALRLAREVSGIPARTIARRAIAAYIQQPIFGHRPAATRGIHRIPAGQLTHHRTPTSEDSHT